MFPFGGIWRSSLREKNALKENGWKSDQSWLKIKDFAMYLCDVLRYFDTLLG